MKTPEEIAEAHATHRDALRKLGPDHPLFRQVDDGLTAAETWLVVSAVEAALEWVLGIPHPSGDRNPVEGTLPMIRAAVREATQHERN
jgi:hypothetical protein